MATKEITFADGPAAGLDPVTVPAALVTLDLTLEDHPGKKFEYHQSYRQSNPNEWVLGDTTDVDA